MRTRSIDRGRHDAAAGLERAALLTTRAEHLGNVRARCLDVLEALRSECPPAAGFAIEAYESLGNAIAVLRAAAEDAADPIDLASLECGVCADLAGRFVLEGSRCGSCGRVLA